MFTGLYKHVHAVSSMLAMKMPYKVAAVIRSPDGNYHVHLVRMRSDRVIASGSVRRKCEIPAMVKILHQGFDHSRTLVFVQIREGPRSRWRMRWVGKNPL